MTYNKYLRNFNRAAIIVPNVKFSMFINELSGNLEIDKIPRLTMPQYYLHLIEMYQNKIYKDSDIKDVPENLRNTISKIAEKAFIRVNRTDSIDVFDEVGYAV